ncbi:hypothetical protein VTN02DRAFT_2706 [Thermoascus thermophilus]
MRHLYLAQGFDFCRRKHAGFRYANFLTDSQHRAAYLATLLQAERQTLDQLYAPASDNQYGITEFDGSGALHDFWGVLQEHAESLKNMNHTALRGSAFEEVEQEREVASQVEEVRQVQRPVHFEALTFPRLHPAILHFAKTGRLLVGSGGYKPAFSALQQTTLGRKHQIGPVEGSGLYVSEEYTRTILRGGSIWHDDFLRPVHWVLWSPESQTAIVIIPEEADELAPIIRGLERPGAHLLVYAAPVTKRMLHFNKLEFYSLPSIRGSNKPSRSLILELGVLAGRLYFEFDEYGHILQYLGRDGPAGVSEPKAPPGGGTTTAPATNLTGFLEEWFTVTRKGQDPEHTPMGYICHGLRLWPHHPFFTTRPGCHHSPGPGPGKHGMSTRPLDDDDVDHTANGDAVSDSENEGSLASEPEFDDLRGEDVDDGENGDLLN